MQELGLAYVFCGSCFGKGEGPDATVVKELLVSRVTVLGQATVEELALYFLQPVAESIEGEEQLFKMQWLVHHFVSDLISAGALRDCGGERTILRDHPDRRILKVGEADCRS